jgi:AraC family transcriptional activator of pobA
MALPTRVRFRHHKYGVARGIDASRWPGWTGIVPDGEAHTLDFVEVLIVHAGQATVHASGTRVPVRGPSIVVTRPDVERRVQVEDPLDVDVVVFPERVVHQLGVPIALSGIGSGAAPVPAADAGDLAAVGRLLHRELTAGLADAPLMLDALLTQFLVRLRRAWPAGGALAKPRVLIRFERLLERHFQQDHRVAAYADRLGVTADHLSAVAREHTGCSAKSLIERRLMREATALLTSTERRVADIAADLGYDEPSHFSRAFRRWAGTSPQRLRATR